MNSLLDSELGEGVLSERSDISTDSQYGDDHSILSRGSWPEGLPCFSRGVSCSSIRSPTFHESGSPPQLSAVSENWDERSSSSRAVDSFGAEVLNLSSEEVSVRQVLDVASISLFHLEVLLALGMMSASHGSEITTLMLLLPFLPELSSVEQGSFVSCTIAGLIFGGVSAGAVASRWGRRGALLLAMLFNLLSCGLFVTAPHSFALLMVCCFSWGLGAGGVFISVPALIGEIFPRRIRGLFMAVAGAFLMSGAVYSVGMAMLVPGGKESWRTFALTCSALPTWTLIHCILRLPESPILLTRWRELQRAGNILLRLKAIATVRLRAFPADRRTPTPVRAVATPQGVVRDSPVECPEKSDEMIAPLFMTPLRGPMCKLSVAAMLMSFNFWGVALRQHTLLIVVGCHLQEVPMLRYLVAACWLMIWTLLVAAVMDRISARAVFMWSWSIVCLYTLCMPILAAMQNDVVLSVSFVLPLAAIAGWCAFATLCVDAFPTAHRAMALAVVHTGMQLGALLQLLHGVVFSVSIDFFVLGIDACMLAVAIIIISTIECQRQS